MKQFDSMEQRLINMYIDLFPPYRPCKNGAAAESSQKQFYGFIQSVFRTLYENPQLLFGKTGPDDFFVNRFNKGSENKKPVYIKMKKCVKSLYDFSGFLYEFGKTGRLRNGSFAVDSTVQIPPKYLSVLEQCGMEHSIKSSGMVFHNKQYPELFDCWTWLSASPLHTQAHFISCMFDTEYAYTSGIFAGLSNNAQAFKTLEAFLIKNNYQRVDNRDNNVNIDYVREYDKKESVLKEAWGERTHGGISVQYDALMKNPLLYSLRVPFYKTLLEHSEEMTDELKAFVVNTGKKCDNCRYCVQMDKTGRRPKAFVTVYHKNKHNMCTYMPGFRYCWESLDQTLVDTMIQFLTFADKTLRNGAKTG